ncbi:MAG: NADH-quinone oxidoreductase subunit L, partial [Hymenobacteraceae bacterium]|nr:NADH-quinone oxidoreductase subunit L [Hymenobacteraceae bacterium]
VFLTFFGEFRGTAAQKSHLHESPFSMTLPLIVLAVLSTVGGFLGIPPVFGENLHIMQNYLSPIYDFARVANPGAMEPMHLDHATEWMLMGISVAVALVAAIIAYVMYVSKKTVPAPEGTQLSPLHNLIYNKYYIDELYDAVIVRPLMWLSAAFHRFVDVIVVDGIVNGFGKLTMLSGRTLRYAQSGAIGFYVLVMVFSIVLILFLNFFIG